MLKIGDKMPEFEVMDQDGNVVKSEDFIGKGRKTIIYFYPKAHQERVEECEFPTTVAGGDASYGENLLNATKAGSTMATWRSVMSTILVDASKQAGIKISDAALSAAGYNVVGVSKDSVKSHTGFRAKYGLPFRLLSDTSTQMLQAFGAWGEKKMYGKTVYGTLRRTFIFSEDGILEEIIEKVDTKNAAGQIL